MAQSYVPLSNLDRSHPIPNNDTSMIDSNATEARTSAQIFGVKIMKHTLELFYKTFVRCLATTIFVAFVLATLKIYQNKDNFTSHQKTTFNVIITALSLCLGLNFFVSFIASV